MNPTIMNSSPQPCGFQVNLGQNNAEVKFAAHLPKYHLFLTPSEAIMLLKPSPSAKRNTPATKSPPIRQLPPTTLVRLKLHNSNQNPQINGLEELPGKINYFRGNNPEDWYIDIPTYSKVKYQNVYPGIDAIYSANQQQLKWDFILQPGANPQLISLDFTGNEGLALDEQGNLLLTVGGEKLRIDKPMVYQDTPHQRKEVSASYQINGDQVHFQLGKYDLTETLFIDPSIEYSTYVGGNDDDYCYASALDDFGNVYVTGLTLSSWNVSSLGFPTKNPYQSNNAGIFNAFITKLDSTGALIYSTYLGGQDSENGWGIAVDSMGSAYVTGGTTSSDFPTTPNAIQRTNNGSWDAFVTKLTPTGNGLLYSTCLGGSEDDLGYSISLDSHGNAYITGYTGSSSKGQTAFPTKNAMQPDNNSSVSGVQDAFVTKINTDGSLGYSTYLGGWQADVGYCITTDAAGNAYVTGSTSSDQVPLPLKGFPVTLGSFQSTFGGNTDAFITKLDPNGSLVYSSYLGGWSYDEGRSIAVDTNGNAYLTGFTGSDNSSSPSFPTEKPLQGNLNGNFDVFVTKINPQGSSLLYSTYLGGKGDDRGYGIAVDEKGFACVTGSTSSSDTLPPGFPLKSPLQIANNGSFDAFIAKIKPDGSDLVYSTYLGGKGDDHGYSIKTDDNGNTYVAGFTSSTWYPPMGPPGFPLKNPIQDKNNGVTDVFALKLTSTADLSVTNSGSPNPLPLGQNLTYQLIITNHGPDPATKIMLTNILPPDVTFIGAFIGTSPCCSETAGTITCTGDPL